MPRPAPEIEPAPRGGPGAALAAADRERVRRALGDALAASTRRAYLGHWAAFADWAGHPERSYPTQPASPDTVAAHLSFLAGSAGLSSLRVRAAAIGAVHRARGLPDPAASELVRRTLGGLARRIGRPPAQAAPLTAGALSAIRATARSRRVNRAGRRESARAAELRARTDIALCSVMRDALLRCGEAARLAWGDITTESDGSGRVAIARSKTDRDGRGSLQYLGRQAMADLRAIRPEGAAPGDPVFGIGDTQVRRRIAAAARGAGLEGRFSGHSPRVGMAQDLAAHGATLAELMQAGRWASSSMPALYTRSQSAGRGAVAKYYAARADARA